VVIYFGAKHGTWAPPAKNTMNSYLWTAVVPPSLGSYPPSSSDDRRCTHDLINSIDELAQDDTLSSELLPYDADVIIDPFVDGDSGDVVFGYQEGGACRESRNSA